MSPSQFNQTIRADQLSLIDEMFIRTADEDYITARWALSNGLTTPYCWLAAHCLEKYLKAVLLANGKTSKNYGHNISQLYEDVQNLAGNTLPDSFDRPDWVEEDDWRDMSPSQFIERLSNYGNPDNRYMIFGYSILQQDIFMLDQLVFFTRRLSYDLDSSIFGNRRSDPTFREIFANDRVSNMKKAQPLDKCITHPDTTLFADAALNRNFSFAPEGYPHCGAVSGHARSEPVILRRVFDSLKHSDRRQVRIGREVAKWLLDNVKLPKDVANEIRASYDAAESRLRD